MDKSYKHIKLTPNVFAEIMVEILDGKHFERQQAIKFVSEYYILHDGVIEPERNLVTVFKKASAILRDKGMSNDGYGGWSLQYKEENIEELISADVKDEVKYIVDETLGNGDYAVYVYYYDIYKKYAELNGKSSWECKVGRTDRDAITRIVSQAGTAYPESPHVALLIRCDDSARLESAIHSVLKFRNKWLQNALGVEWFMTSPSEVKEIYEYICSK